MFPKALGIKTWKKRINFNWISDKNRKPFRNMFGPTEKGTLKKIFVVHSCTRFVCATVIFCRLWHVERISDHIKKKKNVLQEKSPETFTLIKNQDVITATDVLLSANVWRRVMTRDVRVQVIILCLVCIPRMIS